MEEYVTGGRYRSDSEMVAVDASAFAVTVNVSGDGMDAWYNETSWDEWVDLAKVPALPASLKLYKEVQQLGFTIFLLTGRDESQRNITVKNLRDAGYSNWKRLILRQESDLGKLAIVYKSERRKALEDEGYTIHESFGDQWSDLSGFAIAVRSFKLPNPMYYVA
ncbi:hypothetical protein RHGRI_013140 [Rhododendron griersonianum]|uniref:Acid phosphatase n=1 Tax=Rhododendron griersonianum TaxID=479676 RepID=A0AAV6K4R1_9ERIC|nr:hypothetical protein RHGRI_013140 [Rhododendron griersonianum]